MYRSRGRHANRRNPRPTAFDNVQPALLTPRQQEIPMKDPRHGELAKLLVNHSCQIAAGEKVLIEAFDIPPEFTVELVRAVASANGLPIVHTYSQLVQRAVIQSASDAQITLWSDIDRARMERM